METASPVKKRRLTKKQRGFVNDYADKVTGVQAALNNYDTKDYNVANVIAVENLQKPSIQEELKRLGFDTNNAKRVVSEILNSDQEKAADRLNAAEKVFKVHGDYAPEKTLNVNVEVEASPEIKEVTQRLNEIYRSTSEPGDGGIARALDNEAQDKE